MMDTTSKKMNLWTTLLNSPLPGRLEPDPEEPFDPPLEAFFDLVEGTEGRTV